MMRRLRVVYCARCQGEHETVDFNALSTPIACGEWIATHWASCPSNGEPILMRVAPDDERPEWRAPDSDLEATIVTVRDAMARATDPDRWRTKVFDCTNCRPGIGPNAAALCRAMNDYSQDCRCSCHERCSEMP